MIDLTRTVFWRVAYVHYGVESRAWHIHWTNPTGLADFWARGLMQWLLQMTQAQWTYRNATVHLEVKEGWTAAAHKTILKTMESILYTDTEQLHKEH
jgi:hypothetical protein